jgi:hypothetical protein
LALLVLLEAELRLLELDDLRAELPELDLLRLLVPLPLLLDFRLLVPPPRLRELEPPELRDDDERLDPLRDPDPDDLRDDEPPERLDPLDEDDPPLLPPDDSAMFSSSEDARYLTVRAALFHAEGARDVRVVRKAERAPVACVEFALVRLRPARLGDGLEAAREQVVDDARRGRRREPEACAQFGEQRCIAIWSLVEVAAEEERQVPRPRVRLGRGLEDLLGRAGDALEAAVHVRDRELLRLVAAVHEPRPQHAPALGALGERVHARLSNPPGWAHEELVRAALVRADQVGVELRHRAACLAERVARSQGAGGLRSELARERFAPARRGLLEQRDIPLDATEHLRELVAQRAVDLHVRGVALGLPEEP